MSGRPAAGPDVPHDLGWSGTDDAIADVIAEAARTELTGLVSDLPVRHRQAGELIARAGACITESLAALRVRWCLSDHDSPHHDSPHHDALEPRGREPGGLGHGGLGPRAEGSGGFGSGGLGRAGPGYRLPAAMRRLIEHRDRRCCFPGCRRPVRIATPTIPSRSTGAERPAPATSRCSAAATTD
jgi:hypothetical protein